MWRPYNNDRKAREISDFFFKRSWDPEALTGLLEVIQVVSYDSHDHAMTRTVPTGPCCLGLTTTMHLCHSRRSSSLEEKFDVTLPQTQRLLTMDSSLFLLHNSVSSFFFVVLKMAPPVWGHLSCFCQLVILKVWVTVSDIPSPDFLNHQSLCSWEYKETREPQGWDQPGTQ